MTARHNLLHGRMVRALLDLSNPNKCVCLPLVRGKAAGKMDIIYQLYPPQGIHRNSIPATYTFVLDSRYSWLTEELGLMVSLVDTGDGAESLVLGFIAHDCWNKLEQQSKDPVDPQCHFAAVKYNPVRREGFVYLYKEAYKVILKANETRLASCQSLQDDQQALLRPHATGPLSPLPEAPRILYAEDDADLRDGFATSLMYRGYKVTAVENGQQLIDALHATAALGAQYDLVITDHDMPIKTGYQTLKYIKEHESFKHIPVLVFTGNDMREDVEKAGGAFLAKGSDFDLFEELVDRMCRRAA